MLMMNRRVLRVLVLCLVIVATVKIFFDPWREIGGTNYLSAIDPGHFWVWGDALQWKSIEEQKLKPDVPGDENMPSIQESLQQSEKAEKEVIQAPLNITKSPSRVVHLDLKGAAPKVKYLKQVFPLLSSLGAEGILLEYEDMFPYEGELKVLRSPFAYSVEDIEEIKKQAKLCDLELIPLVQVFGHLEFVLKHTKYFHLREVPIFPNSLNPLLPDTVELVKDILMQVMKLHPEAQWFHIGADEVRGLGESEDSKNWLNGNKGDIGKLFLNHVTAVARFMTEIRPGIKLIMWEDMLRKISSATIKESGLQNLAFPMIWNYLPKIDEGGIGKLISKYQEAGFSGVWFASAFKGATAIDQRWTPLDYHLQNHLSWLKVMTSMSKYPSIALQGITLTGWQRYEHHTVLCELLPVGIPSLAVCLQSLKHGSFNYKAQKEVHHILGCKIQMEKDICEGSGAFAGTELYHMVHYIHNNLQRQMEDLMKNNHIRGSFSPYHRKYNFANPRNVGFFINNLKKLLDDWEDYIKNFRTQMESIYYPDTVEEWMEENVNYHMNMLRELVQDAERIVNRNGQPKLLKTL